jgi:hypothetical protein
MSVAGFSYIFKDFFPALLNMAPNLRSLHPTQKYIIQNKWKWNVITSTMASCNIIVDVAESIPHYALALVENIVISRLQYLFCYCWLQVMNIYWCLNYNLHFGWWWGIQIKRNRISMVSIYQSIWGRATSWVHRNWVRFLAGTREFIYAELYVALWSELAIYRGHWRDPRWEYWAGNGANLTRVRFWSRECLGLQILPSPPTWRPHWDEKCRLLSYKNQVRTSQETHYVSATESSQLMLCEIWGFHVGVYEECCFLGYKTQFVLHRRHITSPLQNPAS